MPLPKGNIPWNKGLEHSLETREKIRQKALGRKHTLETRIKMRGRKVSDEAREKIRQAHLGKKFTEEHKKKIGLANSRGGSSSIAKVIRDSMEYRLWRKAVFMRDYYTCVWCGTAKGPFNADHIKPFALYPELRFSIDNGRTLCIPCHKTTLTYGARIRNYKD